MCGKAFFSIRHGKYSTALESLLAVDQEEGKSNLEIKDAPNLKFPVYSRV